MNERIEVFQNSFEQVCNLAFKNLPKDMAAFVVVYVRDKSDREHTPDGHVDFRTLSKGMTYFDGVTCKEYVIANLTPLRQTVKN